MSDLPSSPTPEPAPQKPRAPRAAQDQETANTINTVRTRVVAIKGNAEAVTRLTLRGYGEAGLTEGLGVIDTSQAKFDLRQQAMGAEDIAAAAFKTAESEARAGYKGFSGIAAKVLASDPTLKATVVLPVRDLRDQDKFLTNVEAAYKAALASPAGLAKLDKRGYGETGLQAELAKVKAMSQASADYAAAQQAAKLAFDEREAAYKALKAWWSEFYATAKVAFQGRPDLLGLLDA